MPLTLAALVLVAWAGSVRSQRSADQLHASLVLAGRQVAARQEALGRDLRAAAANANFAGGPVGPAVPPVGNLVRGGLADSATLTGADGAVVASAGSIPLSAPLVLSQSVSLADGSTLTGRVVLSPSAIAALAVSTDVHLTVSVARPRSTGATLVRSSALPGGLWLVAAADRGPVWASERRWAIGLGLGVLLIAAWVVMFNRMVVGRAVRPLERLVGWANAFAPSTSTAISTPADEDQESLARAYRRVARDLRTRSEELHDTRAAFRVALERLGDALAATHDLDGIVEVMIETSLLVLPADAAVYYRVVSAPAKLKATHARGVSVEHLALDGTGVAGHAARTGELTVWPGPALPDPTEPPAVAAVAVPIEVLGRIVGVLGAYGTTVGQGFDADDIRALQTLLRQAAVAMANVELHAQARREALTDGLTGLWNRRHFDLRCRDAQLESDRFGESFAVVLIDVDDFKLVNDLHDHFTGDAALIHLARILRRSSREVDVVARWGGEEFAILVQRGGLDDAVVVAERVCTTLRTIPLEYEGTLVPFTVSCGVASHPESGATVAEVLVAADAALLRAKAAGKNRVERAVPSRGRRPGVMDVERQPR